MGAMASQITSLTIVYSNVYWGADQRKHQRSASLAFVRGIHRWPVKSPHKGPVTRKASLFDDVIMHIYHMYSMQCVVKSHIDMKSSFSYRMQIEPASFWSSMSLIGRVYSIERDALFTNPANNHEAIKETLFVTTTLPSILAQYINI